jgi:hypothetical protein
VVDVGLGSTTAVLVARLTCPQYLRQLTTLVHRASWQRWANNGRGRTGLQRAAHFHRYLRRNLKALTLALPMWSPWS